MREQDHLEKKKLMILREVLNAPRVLFILWARSKFRSHMGCCMEKRKFSFTGDDDCTTQGEFATYLARKEAS
jgi:hypothetical protein